MARRHEATLRGRQGGQHDELVATHPKGVRRSQDVPQSSVLDDGDEEDVYIGVAVVPAGAEAWRQYCAVQGRVRKGTILVFHLM